MSQDIVELLTKWADVLEIPSGSFVNEDLRRAASLITTLTAERDALATVIDRGGEPALMARIIMRSIENQSRAEDAEALVQSMREALEWYSERVGLVGAWSVEGVNARGELTADNGAKALSALAQVKP